MTTVRKHIIFHGRVQEVGFRYTAKYLATNLKLTGWVQNENDGTVVMEVQGKETTIMELLIGLNQARFITIEWMDSKDIPLKIESGFRVR
mgnify:FL=1